MSFTFNGIDFSTYGVEVEAGWVPVGATSAPVKAVSLPASSRVWYTRGDTTPVSIEFPVRILAASAAALITALDNINAALTTDDDAALVFWYTDRYWLARWDGEALRMPILNTCALKTTIRFFAQPNMLATGAVSSGSVAITTNPQTVWIPGPVEGSGTVAGNTTVAPVFIIRNTGTAIAASQFQLWNYVTGDYILYTNTIPNGTYIKFDCDIRIAYTSTNGVDYTAVAGKVNTNWLTIRGGIAQRMTVLGVVTTGTLSWTYRGRYL